MTQFIKPRYISLSLDSTKLKTFFHPPYNFFPFNTSVPHPHHLICYRCYLTREDVVAKR